MIAAMQRRLPVAVGLSAVVAVLGASGGAGKTATSSATGRTRVQLPTMGAAGRCPVSSRRSVTRRFAPVVGDGPVYAAGFRPGAVLRIAPAERFNSRDWGGDKVLSVRRPGVRGTVVVRGRRLDRPGEARFQSGDVPPDHLELRATSPDSWAGYPSYTRVRAPGR
jgi:hypothetical protein